MNKNKKFSELSDEINKFLIAYNSNNFLDSIEKNLEKIVDIDQASNNDIIRLKLK